MRTLDMIRKNILVNKGSFITFAAIPAGAGLFGMILGIIIDSLRNEAECLEFASVFAVIGGMFCIVFGAVLEERESFTSAVTMGVARKAYIPARFVTLLLQIALTWATVILVFMLEKGIFSIIHPGAAVIDLMGELNIPILPLVVLSLVFPAFAMFFGILYVKFERKFFWVLWALWMLLCLGGPRISSAMREHPDSVVGKFGNALFNTEWLNGTTISIFAVVIAIILSFFTVRLYKKQDITV